MLTRTSSGWLSVVPTKFWAGSVPALPVRPHPLPVVSGWHTTVPSALTVRIELPTPQVPVTRDWRTAVSAERLTAPDVPPPLRPGPAVTAVMSPLSASVPHVQPDPLHFATWPFAQDRPPMVAAFAE